MSTLSQFLGGGGITSGKLVYGSGTALTNTGTTTVPAGTYTVGSTTSGVGIITHLQLSPSFLPYNLYDSMYVRLIIDGVTTDYLAGTLFNLGAMTFDSGIQGNVYSRSIAGLYIPFNTSFGYSIHIPSTFSSGSATNWVISGGYIGMIKN